MHNNKLPKWWPKNPFDEGDDVPDRYDIACSDTWDDASEKIFNMLKLENVFKKVEYYDKLLKIFYKLCFLLNCESDSYNSFEQVAEIFCKETGFVIPGKDCKLHSYEERCEKYNNWVDNIKEEAIKLLFEIEEK